MSENKLLPDETPRLGFLTDAQRAELRKILDDKYRGVFRHGEALILDDFIADIRPAVSAVVEFDFLPDPRAAVELEPAPIVIPAKPDPAAAFVGLLMANPGLAADVLGFVREELDTSNNLGYGLDPREARIFDALARLDNLNG